MAADPVHPNARTRLAGILGYPVRHSLSPLIHNTAFRALALNYAYVALEVAPANLESAVRGLPALGMIGANVTIPHKQAVRPFLDRLSEEAAAVGAVNTLVNRAGKLIGYNTDVTGFMGPLEGLNLDGQLVTVLGAGGAARAVIFGILKQYRGCQLHLLARREAQASQVAGYFGEVIPGSDIRPDALVGPSPVVRSSALVVNTTPVGMNTADDESPWPHSGDFGPDQVVYDVIYWPRQTALLRMASTRGAKTIGGMDMLLGQAAAAFRLWTGRAMPLPPVEAAVRRASQSR